jgi:glycolate oxidase FAD binding subunit
MRDEAPSLAETVRAAADSGHTLRLRGGGTKDFYGQALEGEVLDTRGHAGIVAYEPTELVVTVRGGTRLAEVEGVLAERGQMLPFEPPHFGDAATIGGAVAAGLSGPRRQSAGALRARPPRPPKGAPRAHPRSTPWH